MTLNVHGVTCIGTDTSGQDKRSSSCRWLFIAMAIAVCLPCPLPSRAQSAEGSVGAVQLNAPKIKRDWETFDSKSFSVYNNRFSATYYAPDGSLYASVYRPFEASRMALEKELVSVTGQSILELCKADVHVSVSHESDRTLQIYGEVGLSACPKKPLPK